MYIWFCSAAPRTRLWQKRGSDSHDLFSWVRVKVSPTVCPLPQPSGSGGGGLLLQGGLKLPSHGAQTEQMLRVPGPTPAGSLGSRGCWVKGMLGSIPEPTNSTLVGRAQTTTCVFSVEDGESALAQSCQHHPTGICDHKPAWVGGLGWNINFPRRRSWWRRRFSYSCLARVEEGYHKGDFCGDFSQSSG